MRARELAPAWRVARAFDGVMPPMATRGMEGSIEARTRRRPSRPMGGSGFSLVRVLKMGPMAM